MKIKVILALLLSFSLIFSFASCADDTLSPVPVVTEIEFNNEYSNSSGELCAVFSSKLPAVDGTVFPQLEAFNAFCGSFRLGAEANISSIISNNICSPENILNAEIDYEITYLSAEHISVKLFSDFTLSQEPDDITSSIKCAVFDVKNGKQLSLDDFSYNNKDYIIPRCAKLLGEIIFNNKQADITAGYLYPDTDQNKIESLIDPLYGFYLTNDSVGFVFAQNTISLKFAGVRCFEILYDDVSYLLNLLPEPVTEE